MRSPLPFASLLLPFALPDCSPEPAVRCKCSPAAQVMRHDGVVLSDGAVVHPGDRLQLCFGGLSADGWRSVTGLDGSGEETLVHRWQASDERDSCAPFSLLVDDAPGPERVLVTVGDTHFQWVFPKP